MVKDGKRLKKIKKDCKRLKKIVRDWKRLEETGKDTFKPTCWKQCCIQSRYARVVHGTISAKTALNFVIAVN